MWPVPGIQAVNIDSGEVAALFQPDQLDLAIRLVDKLAEHDGGHWAVFMVRTMHEVHPKKRS